MADKRNIGNAIVVDVAYSRGRHEGPTIRQRDLEAVAAINKRKVHMGRKAGGLAENHICRSGLYNDDVRQTVIVDVACSGYQPASPRAGSRPIQAKAGDAVQLADIHSARKGGRL